jgi:hypothetical protein
MIRQAALLFALGICGGAMSFGRESDVRALLISGVIFVEIVIRHDDVVVSRPAGIIG